ncbi:MAG: glycosyltransferase family 2 protein [Candidatus Omnitrophota bacterium]
MENKMQVSVVLPCLNEEDGIGSCIRKIRGVFQRQGINGEIIVVDNSSLDRSREIAASLGARVILEERRGYGAAYLRGLKEARGDFIVIADSDGSYDFEELPKFINPLKEGCDFVIGSRFKGKIEKGAMPWPNRYIGNPLLSGMCRIFFRTRLSDIHCGMRSFTRQAYAKMRLRTKGMEFATEMAVAALQNDLKICEVAVNYRPRLGKSKLNPLFDAWRHIRFMLFYCPAWLYFVPGTLGFILGITILLLLSRGPVLFMGRYWGIHVMIFSGSLCILSYQVLNIGIYAHTYAIREGLLKYDKLTLFLKRHFTLERGIMAGAVIFAIGLGINIWIFAEWLLRDFGALHRIRESILSMALLIIGIQTFFSSFFISFLFMDGEEH